MRRGRFAARSQPSAARTEPLAMHREPSALLAWPLRKRPEPSAPCSESLGGSDKLPSEDG